LLLNLLRYLILKGGEQGLKVLIYALVFIAILVTFYVGAILAGFNLPGAGLIQKNDISGSAVLEVKLVMDNRAQDPLANIEVDVAEEPGPPPEGGVAATNDAGVATFQIKPGSYVVYFNSLSFPENLAIPESKPVTVTKEGPNQVTITVDTKE
jgi:hypothetical protein